jgi:signal transduction histidine kinase
MSPHSNLGDDLRGVTALTDLPPETIEWLASRMESIHLEAGDVLAHAGDPANRMYVLLEGEIHGQRDDGLVFVLKAGQISGMLPYSRLKTIPGTTRAVVPSRVATLSIDHFPEMLERFPVLAQRLVGVMADRIREGARAELQRDKLMSLGKLSAGLAHELNNPAAAAQRAAQGLREAVERLREMNQRLDQQPLSDQQRAELGRFEREYLHAVPQRGTDPLEQSDREQALGEWLEGLGVAEAWTVAASLAEAGLDVARLDQIGSRFPTAALADILWRYSSSLLACRLTAEVESATTRISEMVKAIKEYSYMDQSPIQEVDVHQGIESTLVILKHRLKRGITVTREYDTKLPKICARASELNQVWTNLIDNAIDAMNGNGELRIGTCRDGDYAVVDIVDNGAGIAPEIRGRIFDPFFTTKEVGAGTGLGLDIVHRIVRAHHGDVRVESHPGRTLFQVRLPFQQPKNSGGNA